MTQFHALTPKQAIEAIEAVGVEDAAKLIRDHAAAGLVKTYAQSQVTIAADGQRTTVRDGAVTAELWERMVQEGVDGDTWSGGTVRLPRSSLIGGAPAVHVTGIAFNPAHVQRLAEQQRPKKPAARRSQSSEFPAPVEPLASPAPAKRKADPAAIPPGAILCTIKQAGGALGFGRTKVNELMNSGRLERRMVGSSPRITVASVEGLARAKS